MAKRSQVFHKTATPSNSLSPLLAALRRSITTPATRFRVFAPRLRLGFYELGFSDSDAFLICAPCRREKQRSPSMASESPVRHRQSPRRRSPSRRDESSRSPSPRTKRLRRAQGERSREREDSRGREKRGVERERERRREGDKERTRRDVTDVELLSAEVPQFRPPGKSSFTFFLCQVLDSPRANLRRDSKSVAYVLDLRRLKKRQTSPSMASESPMRHRQSPRRRSPSRSPSPRTKRLRRAQGERVVGRSRDREDSRGREKRGGERERERRRREGDKERTRRDVTDVEVGDKRRRGSGREETEERKRAGADDERQTRGIRERSPSPLDRSSRKSRRSPERAPASRHDEVSDDFNYFYVQLCLSLAQFF
ncbi:hypothetical protein F2Q68_00003261 [Brassica cretica]|uniref:Uncharacterized protein n=1 Tax=Brassica cretica TaxID=69181 RepID=A0A8S9JG47_BRACR|nr:hypothetical protein F2Q68_00003261 [Brassica cretica]